MTNVRQLCTGFVLSLAVLSPGISVTRAEPVAPAAIRGSDAKPGESAAERARALKEAAAKRRKEARDRLQSVVDGKVAQPTAGASGTAAASGGQK